jgi:hypothetical protein
MIIDFTFSEVAKIHYANGYDKDPKAHEIFNRLSNELGGAAYAIAYKAPSFGDYAEAINEIDDEPFMVY